MSLLDLILRQGQSHQGNWSPGAELTPGEARPTWDYLMAPDPMRPRSYSEQVIGDTLQNYQPPPSAAPKPSWAERALGAVGLDDPQRRRRMSEGMMSLGAGMMSRRHGESMGPAMARGVKGYQQSNAQSDQRKLEEDYRARMKELSAGYGEGTPMGTAFDIMGQGQPKGGTYMLPQMLNSMRPRSKDNWMDKYAVQDMIIRARQLDKEDRDAGKPRNRAHAKMMVIGEKIGRGEGITKDEENFMQFWREYSMPERLTAEVDPYYSVKGQGEDR